MNLKKIFAFGFLSLSIGLSIYSHQDQTIQFEFGMDAIEALASGEDEGDHLTCYCALMSDNNCAVNNNGSSKCASGNNVRCWEYDRNCN